MIDNDSIFLCLEDTYIRNFHRCPQISGKRFSHVLAFLWFQSSCSCHGTRYNFRRRAKYIISSELLGLGIWYLLLSLCVQVSLQSPTEFTLLCYLRYRGRLLRTNTFFGAEWYLTNSIYCLLRCNAITRKTKENKNIVIRKPSSIWCLKNGYKVSNWTQDQGNYPNINLIYAYASFWINRTGFWCRIFTIVRKYTMSTHLFHFIPWAWLAESSKKNSRKLTIS